MNSQKSLQKGFSMIELTAAIAILSIGILGLYGVFYSLANIASTYPLRLTADYLAQEGIEISKNIRDNNFLSQVSWSAGLVNCTAGCQADYKTGTAAEGVANTLSPYNASNFLKRNADGFYSYDSGTATPFTRKITVTQPGGADEMKIDVQVSWTYKGQAFSIQVTEYLYNWY